MTRHLRRSQTVDWCCITRAVNLRIDIGIAGTEGQALDQGGQIERRIDFDTPGRDRFQILALAVGSVPRDKSDTGKDARASGQGHVGDGIVELVVESGDAQRHHAAVPVQPQFGPLDPLGFEQLVRSGRVVTDPERPEQLVERRQAPAQIGGTAKCQRIRRVIGKAAASGKFGPVAIGKLFIGPDRTGKRADQLDLAAEAIVDRPEVNAPAAGEDQRLAGLEAGLDKSAIGRGAAPCPAATARRIIVGKEEILLGLALGPPPVAANPQFDCIANRRPHFETRAEAGGRHIILLEHPADRIAIIRNAAEADIEIADLDVAERRPLPAGAAIDQPEARVRAVIVVFAERKAALAVIGEGADIGLQFGAVR